MNEILKIHPSFVKADEIKYICNSLQKIDITYFAQGRVDKDNNFCAISNNPKFAEHYLKMGYYNADIHMAKEEFPGKYILWDDIPVSESSNQMIHDAEEFGLMHTFSIIERYEKHTDFYHFSSNLKDKTVNQCFLNNIDMLESFIQYFKDAIKQSRDLSKAFNIKLQLTDRYSKVNQEFSHELENKRSQFFKSLFLGNNGSKKFKMLHKDSNELLLIAPKQLKCLNLLLNGKSPKEIAETLDLTPKTVSFYTNLLRQKFNCYNKQGLIKYYHNYNHNIDQFIKYCL